MAPHISTIPPEARVEVRDDIDWKNVVGGIAVLGAFIAIAFALLPLICRSMSHAPGYSIVAYFPGSVDIDEKTEVFLHRAKIGTVREVQPAVNGLQVRISAPGLFERSQVATLLPPDSVVFDDGKSVLVLPSLTQGILRHAGTTCMLTKNGEGKWTLTAAAQSVPLSINDGEVSLRRNSDTLFVGNGDVLGFGGMKLEWHDIESFTRIRAELDSTDVLHAAGFPDSLRPSFSQITGYGSEVRVTTLFGFSRPSVQLLPSYSNLSLIENRTALREFAPQSGIDVQALAENAGAYLFSRSKLHAVPANRYELAVADINTLIHNIASVSDRDGGRGMISRLLLDRGTLAQLDGIIHDLHGATSSVRTLIDKDSGNGLVTRLLFKDEDAVRRFNDLPGQVDSVFVSRLPEILVRLKLTLMQAEEMLGDIQRTSEEGRRQVRSLGDNPAQLFRSPKK